MLPAEEKGKRKMTKHYVKRLVKLSLIGIAAFGIVALALALTLDTASAQGPGGNGGRGRGGNGGAQGQGMQLRDGSELGAGTGYGYNNNYAGAGYGAYMNGNANQIANQGQVQMGALLVDLPPAGPTPLPGDVVAALNAALLDEWRAYDTYQMVIDQFGAVRPFTAIQSAETQHATALEFLFERYGLALPAREFVSVTNFASLSDACSLGAEAEVANFALYDSWVATASEYPDITQVFTALRNASEFQHLPAFERCAG